MWADGNISANESFHQLQGGNRRLRQAGCTGQLFADAKAALLPAIAPQTEMPDFHESGWKNMNEKSADKLMSGNCHGFPLGAILVVPPFEGDLIVFHTEDTLVGDGDPMGIAPQIFHNSRGMLEGWFAVSYPLLLIER